MYQKYSGFEWLMIDLASRYKNGKQKETYAKRIKWVHENLYLFQVDTLEELKINLKTMVEMAEEKFSFVGAAIAIWDTLQGRESNWQVSQDSASSGPQLMSCMTKCITGMTNTGVLGIKIPDMYTTVNDHMGDKGVRILRKALKEGMMPFIYAGTADAKKVFGESYPHFVKSYQETVPGAYMLAHLLANKAWNSNATEHVIVAPDAFVGKIPVIIDTYKGLPYLHHNYRYDYRKIGKKKAGKAIGTKALAANTIQLYDAYILRELNRRCDYNRIDILTAIEALQEPNEVDEVNDKGIHLRYLEQLSVKFKQVSAVALEYIDKDTTTLIGDKYRIQLITIFEQMLLSKCFTLKNVHDDFACLPNYVGHMKDMYNILLRETYMGRWVFIILKDLTGKKYKIPEVNTEVADAILNAPYSIS